MTDRLAEIKACHREKANKDGFSTWYIRTPRRRKIQLQLFKGRLYLLGCLYEKNSYSYSLLLEFETPLRDIIKKFGPLEDA